MRKPAIGADEKRPPYAPVLTPIESLDLPARMYMDQAHMMWIKTPQRKRGYWCSLGIFHLSYYRTHWRQGREDWVACEHEVLQ